MSVTIPSSDAASTQLNGDITALTTQISNVGTASPVYARLVQMKANAQFQLVMHLLGAGHLSSASILSNETYITQPVSDGQ